MKIRALVGFTGALSMHKGEVAECGDEAVLRDLISAGYIELAGPPEPKQTDEKPPVSEPPKPKARKQSKKSEAADENQ